MNSLGVRRCFFLVAVIALHGGPISADDSLAELATDGSPVGVAGSLRVYKSKHLHVRTDLPDDDADALFARLERTLKFAAKYWSREPRGQIDCYVVHNLKNWQDTDLPHRLARIIVHGVGGATVGQTLGRGKRRRNMPTVIASSRKGIAEHEVVHAYCIQTFGTGGPEWYKEGMAEMVTGGSSRAAGIQCSREQVASLRTGKRSTVHELFAVGETRVRLSAALQTMLEDPAHAGRHVSLDAWTQQYADHVVEARDEYLRSWAFCYMLLHNPNYAKRFRTMGNLMLISDDYGPFEEFFDPVQHEIAFEYAFLLDHMTAGFRADLCQWDWQTRFELLTAGNSHRTRVVAARGFQASGVRVVAGQGYTVETDGRWSTDVNRDETDADGHEDHSGRLVGAVMDDFKLGEPFLLGTSDSFRAPADGQLYLRCNDAWNEIGDNAGQIVATFRMK